MRVLLSHSGYGGNIGLHHPVNKGARRPRKCRAKHRVGHDLGNGTGRSMGNDMKLCTGNAWLIHFISLLANIALGILCWRGQQGRRNAALVVARWRWSDGQTVRNKVRRVRRRWARKFKRGGKLMKAIIHASCREVWRGADRIGGKIDDRAEARKARLPRDRVHGRRGLRKTRQTLSRVKQAPRKAVANNSRLGQQGDNAVGAPKERGGWALGRKGRGGMAGRAVLSMAVWGIGMGGMHCRHEQ